MKPPHQLRPGNRYARETGTGRTLGEMVLAKMALVAVCRRCKHRRLLYPAEQALGLIRAFDPERMRIVQSGFDKEDLLAKAA
jgi:hypothetical protein